MSGFMATKMQWAPLALREVLEEKVQIRGKILTLVGYFHPAHGLQALPDLFNSLGQAGPSQAPPLTARIMKSTLRTATM